MVPVAEKIAERKKRQALEAQLAALTGSGRVLTEAEFVEHQANIDAKAKAEEAAMLKAKDFDGLRAEDARQATAKLEAATTQVAALTSRLEQQDVNSAITAELSKAGVTAIADAMILVRQHVRIKADPTGEKPPTVIGDDGMALLDDKGETVTVAAATRAWVESDSGARFLPPSGDTGSGTRNTGSPGGMPGLTQAALLADPVKHHAFLQEKGGPAFYALPRK